jgi:hypothetical protein
LGNGKEHLSQRGTETAALSCRSTAVSVLPSGVAIVTTACVTCRCVTSAPVVVWTTMN